MSEQGTQVVQGTQAAQIESNMIAKQGTQAEQGTQAKQGTQATQIESSKCKKKRKPIEPRSQVWKEFTKFKDQKGNEEKASCNFCEKELCVDTNRNGTTNLKAHMKTCKGKEEKKQALI